MKQEQDVWLQKYWRPLVAIAYIVIILFDFVVAPVMWSILQAVASGSVVTQWAPLTLLSGGIFHAAIGAVLGVSAFTRGQEKIARLKNTYQKGTNDDAVGKNSNAEEQRNQRN